jgi:hypothetical protein
MECCWFILIFIGVTGLTYCMLSLRDYERDG